MHVLIWLFLIFITGFAGSTCLGLHPYVSHMDDEKSCDGCDYYASCIAKKELFRDSNYVSSFMLYTYYKVKGFCRFKTSVSLHKHLFYLLLNAIPVTILYWSREFDVTCVVFSVSTSMLLALGVVDWNTEYIPVEYTGVIFLCGLIRLFADVSNWWQYVIGLIAVSGFLYIVDIISTPILRKRYGDDVTHAMGDGDIKLMAATGLLLGWKLNFLALGLGCVAGSVIHLFLMQIKKGERQFAFGPYLSLGVYLSMICGEQLVSWYLNMMRV